MTQPIFPVPLSEDEPDEPESDQDGISLAKQLLEKGSREPDHGSPPDQGE